MTTGLRHYLKLVNQASLPLEFRLADTTPSTRALARRYIEQGWLPRNRHSPAALLAQCAGDPVGVHFRTIHDPIPMTDARRAYGLSLLVKRRLRQAAAYHTVQHDSFTTQWQATPLGAPMPDMWRFTAAEQQKCATIDADPVTPNQLAARHAALARLHPTAVFTIRLTP